MGAAHGQARDTASASPPQSSSMEGVRALCALTMVRLAGLEDEGPSHDQMNTLPQSEPVAIHASPFMKHTSLANVSEFSRPK